MADEERLTYPEPVPVPVPVAPLARIALWPANVVTLLRMALVALLVVPMLMGHRWNPVAAGILFVVGYWASDFVDGWIARRTGTCSSFGESLDLVSDRFCDLMLCAYVLAAAPEYRWVALAFLLLRIAPDTFLCRFLGLKDNLFYSAVEMHSRTYRFLVRREGTVKFGIEFNHAIKTIFFGSVLFDQHVPYLEFFFLAPVALYAVLAVEVMNAHARAVLERGE
ncbi:MAG: CDP-alcohol phosphatidyltransferase family protein [Rhodospirillales bacterium]